MIANRREKRPNFLPGDYFVVRTRGLAALAIRLATRSRYNHAGVIIDDAGTTIEAKAEGAEFGTLAAYAGRPLLISRYSLRKNQRELIRYSALGLLETPYGWSDLLWLALAQWRPLDRSDFLQNRIANRDHLVCSQLVALAYIDAGVRVSEDRFSQLDVTPGDLARRING